MTILSKTAMSLAAATALFVAHSVSNTAFASNQRLTMEPCHVQGLAEQVECGFYTVPENYDEPQGRTLDLYVVRLPAVSSGRTNDPVFFLAGGPGQAATELTSVVAQLFRDVRQTRDIILVDQRGTGKSNPLECPLGDLGDMLVPDQDVDLTGISAGCAAEIQSQQEIDFQHYNTVNAIRDFDSVRAALGYQQVNLYGGSYGTRAGLVWMREKPESLRSVVLDGLAPTQVVIGPFGTFSQRAFDILNADCAAQEGCLEEFGDISETYYVLREQLLEQPQRLTIRDARSDEPHEVLLTATRMASILRAALYSPRSRQLMPLAIREAAEGNWRPISGLAGSFETNSPLYMGLMMSVLCQEDLPRADAELLARDADNRFIGGSVAREFQRMCAGWPVQPLAGTAHAEPVHSTIPTLLLSGRQDPVTPPEWGDLAAETLPNSQHFVAEHGGHTIFSHTCANRMIDRFLQNPTAEVDGKCLEQTRLLPFVRNVNAAGM